MALERELKLDASLGLPDLSSHRELAGYPLRYLGLERQENTYYDTATLALRAAGATLRVRETQGAMGGRVLTLKEAPLEPGAVVSREELESEAPPAIASATDVADPATRERLERLSGGAPLAAVARTRTARRRFDLVGVGELTLDEVTVLDPSGSEVTSFAEVELEATPQASDSDLEIVQATLQALAPLRPSLKGKYTRALEALDAGLNGPSGSWRAFAARTLAAEIERLRAFAPIAAAGIDPEGVHGMRVSTRRLRSALRFFAALLPNPDDLRAELRWLGQVLGAVRDHDVLGTSLPLLAEGYGFQASEVAPVIALLAADRREARSTLLRVLASARYRALLARLVEVVRDLGSHQTPGEDRADESVAAAAPSALDGLLGSVRRHARQAGAAGATLEDVHALRKAVKRLRYALEFLGPAAPDLDAAASELKDLQGDLGEINDRASARQVLAELAPRLSGREEAFTAGRLAGRLEAELADEQARLRRDLDRFRFGHFRGRVLDAIAGS
jgi:triphosphatase